MDDVSRYFATYVAPHVLYFFDALELAAQHADGFDQAAVDEVRAYWEFFDSDLATCGYVVQLRDGRRAYLEITVDDTLPEHKETIVVRYFSKDETRPGGDTALPNWSDDAADINGYLRQGRRPQAPRWPTAAHPTVP